MIRIAETFARLRRGGKRALIPFITAGDPDLKTTRDLLVELARAGASLIELGVPFTDPMADGPVIQRASMRALRNGIDVAKVLDIIREARHEIDVPVVLFSYFNPLLQIGAGRLSEGDSARGRGRSAGNGSGAGRGKRLFSRTDEEWAGSHFSSHRPQLTNV